MSASIAQMSKAYFAKHPQAPRTTLYLFERQNEAPDASTINRIDGPPFGIDLNTWPCRNDDKNKPMQHMFTIDLATTPELQNRVAKNVHAIALFVHNPNENEAWEPFHADAKVVHLTDDDLAKGLFQGDIPTQHSDAKTFHVLTLEIPTEIFPEPSWTEPEDPDLNAIYGELYTQSTWAYGKPIWLQGDENKDPNFLMQFDEQFVDINLGDAGIMYVFPDTAFWQCG